MAANEEGAPEMEGAAGGERDGAHQQAAGEVQNPNPHQPGPGHDPPTDDPNPAAALREQLAQMAKQLANFHAEQQAREDLHRREEAAYHDRMREMERMIGQLEQLHLRQAPTPPHLPHVPPPQIIEVTAPPQPPRLKIFTGLPPASKEETSYVDWRRQVKAALSDSGIRDPLGYLKRSLQGRAASVARPCTTPAALLSLFDELYGETQSAEELFASLLLMRQGKQQSSPDLLTEICMALDKIRELSPLTDGEYHTRMYMVFAKACASPALVRELRAAIGIPGSASPTYRDVFRYLRQVENLEKDRREARPSTTTAVAAHEVASPPSFRGRGRGGGRPVGPSNCFICALTGHRYLDCRNPLDVEAVRREFGEVGVRRAIHLDQQRQRQQGNE